MKPLPVRANSAPLARAIAAAFVLGSASAGVGAQVIDLAQAYRDALANDTVVASARAQLEATRRRLAPR